MHHGEFADVESRSRGEADAAVYLPEARRLFLGLQCPIEMCSSQASRTLHSHLLQSADRERPKSALLRLVPRRGNVILFRMYFRYVLIKW